MYADSSSAEQSCRGRKPRPSDRLIELAIQTLVQAIGKLSSPQQRAVNMEYLLSLRHINDSRLA